MINEIVPTGEIQNLTDHLNQVDSTGLFVCNLYFKSKHTIQIFSIYSTKCTHEPERDGQIPFLDTMIIKMPDNTVKLKVYRKTTHMDQ